MRRPNIKAFMRKMGALKRAEQTTCSDAGRLSALARNLPYEMKRRAKIDEMRANAGLPAHTWEEQ